jgi:hypothetical protein
MTVLWIMVFGAAVALVHHSLARFTASMGYIATRPGPHTGQFLAVLRLSDLVLHNSGAWNYPPSGQKWNKSTLVNLGGMQAVKVHHDKYSGTTGDSKLHPEAVGGIGLFAVPRGLPMTRGGQGVVFSFDAFFPNGYRWAKGGKIAGSSIGPGKSSGCNHVSDGASNRIMFQENGGAILYIYVPVGSRQPEPRLRGTDECGFGVFKAEFAGALKTGKWNRLQIGTKLNTFTNTTPNADGAASLTINGVTHTLNNIVWRLKPEHALNDVFLSEFFGGPDPSPIDQDCYYANFSVSMWKD